MEQQQQKAKVVIVTGSNKGLGYALIEKLIQQYPNYKIILTARNPTLGEEARNKLIEKHPSAKNNLFFHKLDIKNSADQDNFFNTIKNTYGKIDVLVNNAGVSGASVGATDTYEDLFGTNYHATVNLTEKLLPLLADDGRIVMTSSILGRIGNQAPTWGEFLSQPQTTDQINAKLKELEAVSLKGNPQDFAQVSGLYSSSKAFLNAYSRWVLAPRLKAGQSVISIHPGWCETDLSGWCQDETLKKLTTSKTAEEGTKTALYVIGLDNQRSKELNGNFLDDETRVVAF